MNSLSIAVLIALLAVPALAGGPTAVEPDPAPAVAAPVTAHDWSGPYVGLSYGAASGGFDYVGTAAYDIDSGNALGLFAGYLIQRGTLVYGGELAFSRGRDIYPAAFSQEGVDRMFDLKAKAGFATNRTLFYGVLGYSNVSYEFQTVPAQNFDAKGLNYGLGVDVALSERLALGLEYLSRQTEGQVTSTVFDADLDVNTLSLRVGLSF